MISDFIHILYLCCPGQSYKDLVSDVFVHSRDVQTLVSLHISCDPCILKLKEIGPQVGFFFSCWRKVKFPQNIMFILKIRKLINGMFMVVYHHPDCLF